MSNSKSNPSAPEPKRRITFELAPRRHASPPATETVEVTLGKHEESESEGEDINEKNLRRSVLNTVSIPKPEFRTLVNQIAESYADDDIRFTADAMNLLQEEAEKMMVEMFENANEMAKAAGREKVKVEDIDDVLDSFDEY